jgi:hypothetical protein
MAFDMTEHKTRLTAVRIYEDQLTDLRWLITHKYHDRLKIADLIREALDRYIDAEKTTAYWKSWNHKKPE